MFPAFLTTIFFSLSAVTGNRCAKIFGGVEANFYRLCIATLLLGAYVHAFGAVVSGAVAPAFVLSGIVGVGVGDLLFFQALPRIGSRLTVLLIQCLSVPFAALVEWLWLGTTLHFLQVLWITLILSGLIVALPQGSQKISGRELLGDKTRFCGVLLAIFAAIGNGVGAVLSRKAYAAAANVGENVNGFSAAYARVLGGLGVAMLVVLVLRWREVKHALSSRVAGKNYREKWRIAWPWVISTSLAGQTFGVTCFQWALKNNPTAVVLPIVAMTPLIAIPMTSLFENERPGWRAVLGAGVSVAGVVLLLRFRG